MYCFCNQYHKIVNEKNKTQTFDSTFYRLDHSFILNFTVNSFGRRITDTYRVNTVLSNGRIPQEQQK